MEIQHEINNELAVTEEAKDLRELKSLFYRLNAKPDTTTKVYTDRVKVDLSSIEELNARIIEKLKLHYVETGFVSAIIIAFSDRKTLSFDCWEAFIQHKFLESSSVKSIVLTWDFTVKLNGYENPQRHKLTVKLSAGLRPEEILNLIMTGKIDNMDELDSDQFPIIAQMDFIDTQLCEEFINIVSEWVKSLEKTSYKKNKIMLSMRKHRKIVAKYFNYASLILLIILGVVGINFLMSSFNIIEVVEMTYQQFNYLINYFVIFVIVLFLCYKLSDSMAERIFDSLYMYSNGYIFDITKGDKNKQHELEENDKKTTFSIFFKVIFSIIFNIGCGIASAFLMNILN